MLSSRKVTGDGEVQRFSRFVVRDEEGQYPGTLEMIRYGPDAV